MVSANAVEFNRFRYIWWIENVMTSAHKNLSVSEDAERGEAATYTILRLLHRGLNRTATGNVGDSD